MQKLNIEKSTQILWIIIYALQSWHMQVNRTYIRSHFRLKISATGNAYLIKGNLGYCKDFHYAEFFFTTRKRCHVTPSSYSYLLFFQLFWIIIQVLKIPKKLFTSEFTCGNLFNFFPKQDFLDFLEQILFGVFVVTNMLYRV